MQFWGGWLTSLCTADASSFGAGLKSAGQAAGKGRWTGSGGELGQTGTHKGRMEPKRTS